MSMGRNHLDEHCHLCKRRLSVASPVNRCAICGRDACTNCVDLTREGVMVCLGTKCHLTAKQKAWTNAERK